MTRTRRHRSRAAASASSPGDVPVFEGGQDLALAPEPRRDVATPVLTADEFDRDAVLERAIGPDALVHRPHPPSPQEPRQPVTRDRRANPLRAVVRTADLQSGVLESERVPAERGEQCQDLGPQGLVVARRAGHDRLREFGAFVRGLIEDGPHPPPPFPRGGLC